ncbi:hypothetical protein [Hyphomonas sp.]|uniref:hypothetical protein n=1 Tax=Hyphomonas sp. TaxID=87 RepID=UPI003526EC5A
MSFGRHRVAILHTEDEPQNIRRHLICIIEDALKQLGVDIVDLYGTDKFVPADLLFVHYDRSVVPTHVERFARQYRRRINAGARDIRKHTYADGLLAPDSPYEGRVIVKSTLNYGGQPEESSRSLLTRIRNKASRLAGLRDAPLIHSKQGYRIYERLSDVPAAYFSHHHVVQKLQPEWDGEKNILREYIFLGNNHFENIERSSDLIITEDENVSCHPFNPHPRLLEMRRKLKLDYGKLDYTMIDGEPFIFDANKTLGLGEYVDQDASSTEYVSMLHAFALEIVRILNDPEFRSYDLTRLHGALRAGPARLPQPQPGALPAAKVQNG